LLSLFRDPAGIARKLRSKAIRAFNNLLRNMKLGNRAILRLPEVQKQRSRHAKRAAYFFLSQPKLKSQIAPLSVSAEKEKKPLRGFFAFTRDPAGIARKFPMTSDQDS
jgi:hypothetical protein